MIEFRGVTKRYPDGTVAVDELDLEVEAGRITVFVGPVGLRQDHVAADDQPDDRADAAARSSSTARTSWRAIRRELRRGIGYVIQQAGLFPHRTILDNIATVPLLLGWNKAKARKRAAELMETVGLAPEMAKRYPTQLSGGQQQRVGVARALAADPPILLMDEPFSAVDPVVRESLQEELLRLQGELGKTIVFVTHDIDEAVKLGDKVAVLRVGGKLAQFDEPGHLLARPVDDFVDNFVGRDRGYRGLGFRSSAALTLGELPTVTLGEKAARHAGWVLVVDAEGRPQGWLNTAESARRRRRGRTSTSCRAARCTTWGPARCAARSTPRCPRRPGVGVAVDEQRRGRRVGQRRRRAARARRRPPRRRGLRSAHDLGARQPRPHRGAAVAAPLLRHSADPASGSCSRSRWAGWPTATPCSAARCSTSRGCSTRSPRWRSSCFFRRFWAPASSTRPT